MRRRVHSTGRRRLPLARRLVETTVATIIVILMVMTWHLQCFIVSGASMAEMLVGQHRQVICGDCGETYRCAADEPIMPGKRAVCPNCGDNRQRLDLAPEVAADGVLVDRSAFVFRGPRRWELAAFRAPTHASQVYVKRVVGLPGETIKLRDGDLYADDQIQRKSLAQLRAMAVLVHDSSHESVSLRSRWTPAGSSSGWRQDGSRFSKPASSRIRESFGGNDDGPTSGAVGRREPIDWLVYHHDRRRPGAPDVVDEIPITDDSGYNQTWPVTRPNLIRDVLVRCRMRISPGARVIWLLTDGLSQFLVELNFHDKIATVTQDRRQVGRADLPPELTTDSLLCEVGLCDEQVLLGLNGQQIIALAYSPANAPFRPTSRPVAFGSQADELEIWDLVLLRDVYYLAGKNRGDDEAQDSLADNEYFMLGDNSRHSGDSREWVRPGVPADDLVGKPFAAFPGIRAPAGGQLQVPEFNRFRYIH
jgi:signal peptidase I